MAPHARRWYSAGNLTRGETVSAKPRWIIKYKRTTFNGATYWVRVGAAFQGKDGNIAVVLEALPTGEWDGSLMMFVPEADEEAQ